MNDSVILFWLSTSGLSVKKQKKIIQIAGAVDKVPNAFKTNEEIRLICKDKYSSMQYTLDEEYINATLLKLKQDGIFVCTMLNPLYPQRFIDCDPTAPLSFYYKGDLSLLKTECIAVVGSRSVSRYGKNMTYKFVGDLVRGGFTIVSGLATGIDGFAHQATLDAGGKTIAVLGSGLNVITPVSNAGLYDDILANGGLIISEYPPSRTATKYTFPERNRIVSGISKGVLVVEAGLKSGALITASLALEQNKDVFAVPGNLDSNKSAGTNNLIYEGAQFVRSGEDICAFYGVSVEKIRTESTKKLDNDQKNIYSFLSDGEKSLDEMVENLNIPPVALSAILTEMELDGLIERTSADNYVIVE